MNGATTEPCAIIRRPPIQIIIKTIGASQSFFLFDRNFKISSKNSKKHLY